MCSRVAVPSFVRDKFYNGVVSHGNGTPLDNVARITV